MRKSAHRRVRLKRVPVTGALLSELRQVMHTQYVVLQTKFATLDNVQMLRDMFDTVGFTIEGDERFSEHMVILNSGFRALKQVAEKGAPVLTTEDERAPVLNAINVIDGILPRLDGTKLYLANVKVNELKLVAAEQ
jgi:hypothetical protein